jgi:hypothetical protein
MADSHFYKERPKPMDTRHGWHTSIMAMAVISMGILVPAMADGTEPGKIPAKQTTQATTPAPDKQATSPEAREWQLLAGNDLETVYIKEPPHGLDPNITGIDAKVVARTKEVFDYAQGIAMADCETRDVFPASGEIYDAQGKELDPMGIPILKALPYIRYFPKEAYDGLLKRLCEWQGTPTKNKTMPSIAPNRVQY